MNWLLICKGAKTFKKYYFYEINQNFNNKILHKNETYNYRGITLTLKALHYTDI